MPPPESSAGLRLRATAADEPPPGWVMPAVTLGLGLPALASATRRDVDLLRRLPPMPGERLARVRSLPGLPAATLTGVALGLALVFGFVRLGISDVYTESWLFLVLALLLGVVSPAAGLLLAIAFVPMDLLAVITRGTLDPLLPALAGRVISWWLLWLLAVVVPLVARQVPAAVLATGRPASPKVLRLLAYAGSAAVLAGLLWLWCGAVAELIRPALAWTSMLGNPRPSVTGPITDGRDGLLIVAVMAALAWTVARDLVRIVDDEAAADIEPPTVADRLPSLPVRLRPVRWVAATALGLLLLGAMITSPVDILLLGAALLAAKPGVRWLLRRFPVAMLLAGQLPWLVRLALGCAAAWLVASIVTFLLAGPMVGSERFPIVVATSVAILVLALFLEVDAATDDVLRERDERAAARSAAAGPTIIAAAVALAGLLLPTVALAQGSVVCPLGEVCLPSASVSAAAAVGSAALLALTMGTGGRFVSKRRDAAVRRPTVTAARAEGVGGLVERGRAAILAAWRAG